MLRFCHDMSPGFFLWQQCGCWGVGELGWKSHFLGFTWVLVRFSCALKNDWPHHIIGISLEYYRNPGDTTGIPSITKSAILVGGPLVFRQTKPWWKHFSRWPAPAPRSSKDLQRLLDLRFSLLKSWDYIGHQSSMFPGWKRIVWYQISFGLASNFRDLIKWYKSFIYHSYICQLHFCLASILFPLNSFVGFWGNQHSPIQLRFFLTRTWSPHFNHVRWEKVWYHLWRSLAT